MSRSLKKGPYINVSLEKKILAMNESGKKNVVKTWARASMISPVNRVHNNTTVVWTTTQPARATSLTRLLKCMV